MIVVGQESIPWPDATEERTRHRASYSPVVVIVVLLGGFDERVRNLDFRFSWIRTRPARARIPDDMVEEIRVNRVGFVVFVFHHFSRCFEPSLLQGAVRDTGSTWQIRAFIQ